MRSTRSIELRIRERYIVVDDGVRSPNTRAERRNHAAGSSGTYPSDLRRTVASRKAETLNGRISWR